ncbi:MAG: UDP-N-acetylmuramate dehydrogenase [Candidatus Colwellbacteria bacterium]|nr:UDP-N-acetylmuramate dehydrogenase [Candidatus Colwellbacteria bacterium]
MKIKESVTLAPLTTLNVGGPARYFVEAKTISDIEEAIKFAKDKNLPVFILSGGSNILVSDDGFDGLVILNRIAGFKSEIRGDKVILTIGAGENWDATVAKSVENNWAGLELMSGIPGSVGAAPVQNIGAYGAEVSSVIKKVKAFDLKTNKVVEFSKVDCEFSYRKSIFNSEEKGRYVILELMLELMPALIQEQKNLNYHDLQEYFKNKPNPTLKEIRQAVIEIRAGKGYVIMPGYKSYKTAGSFFKNPVVSQKEFEGIKNIIGENDSKWFWPQNPPAGGVKVAAAKLMEKAGFGKGHKEGNVGISPKHSLSLINLGRGTAKDLVNLAGKIIKGVYNKFHIRLETEVILIGFTKNPFKS